MVTINSEDPDRAAAAGEDVVFRTEGNTQYFAATHRGYEKLHGVLHRRRVMMVDGRFFLIWDDIHGPDVKAEWNIHVADPSLLIVAAPGPWREARARGLAEGKEIDWIRFEGNVKQFAVVLYPFENELGEVSVDVQGRSVVVKTPAGAQRITVPED
jgi:hypothetical protein